MCGIAGWNLIEKPSDSFFTALAAVMQDRGEESYGLFANDKVTRGVGSILEELPAATMSSQSGFLHTRHATHGKVTIENAHPFSIGNLIGAHNGVIWNHAALNQKHARKNQVDSMHIFDAITQNLPLSEIDGYGAIEYVQNGEFFVGRCNGGELEIALTSIGVVWASTARAIHSAVKQASIKLIHFYTVETGKVYRIAKDNVYETDKTFQLNNNPPKTGKTDWKDFDSRFIASESHGAGDSAYWNGVWKQDLEKDYASEILDDKDDTLYTSRELDMLDAFDDMETIDGPCELCGKVTDVAQYLGSHVCAHCFCVVQ